MYYYSNTSVLTTLTNDVDAVQTSIQIGDTTGLPVVYPYTLILDYEGIAMEVVTVTSSAGSSLIVTRGQDGTSAQAHVAGAKVVHGCVARDLQEPQNHIAASQNVHGIGASSFVVGTLTPQTLVNKTIDGDDNTLLNIPAGQVTGTFGDADFEGEVTIDPISSGLRALIVTERGSAAPSAGIIVRRDSATIGTAKLIDLQNEVGSVSLWSVDRGGNLVNGGTAAFTGNVSVTTLSASGTASLATVTATGNISSNGDITAGADGSGNLTVNGTSTLNSDTAITQANAGTPGLLVTAHASPTQPTVRLIGAPGSSALQVRRNNSTLSGTLQTWATEAGTVMASVTRGGVISGVQTATGTESVNVTALAGATVAAVEVTGVPDFPAVRIKRNNSTSTGSLQRWADESGAQLSAVTRTGNFVGPDYIVSSGSYSLVDRPRLSLQKTNTQSIPNLTNTSVIFNTTVKNVGSFTYNAATGQFNVPVDGFYLIVGNLNWATNSDAGAREIMFAFGATTQSLGNMLNITGGAIEVQSGATMVNLTTADNCFFQCSQNSGVALNISAARFTIQLVGLS